MRNDFLYGPEMVVDQDRVSRGEGKDLIRPVMILQIQDSDEVSTAADPA